MLLKDLYQKVQRAKSLNSMEIPRREEVNMELDDIMKDLEKLGNVQSDSDYLIIMES
jgi:hypothetical protein